jgi:hypothetical protein
MAFVVIPPFFLSAQETDALFVPDRVIEAQVIALRTNKPNFPLNDIVVDLKLNRIETRYGILKDGSEVDNEDEESPTGPWSGVQWQYQNVNEMSDLP